MHKRKEINIIKLQTSFHVKYNYEINIALNFSRTMFTLLFVYFKNSFFQKMCEITK